jgi:hypothetical protein
MKIEKKETIDFCKFYYVNKHGLLQYKTGKYPIKLFNSLTDSERFDKINTVAKAVQKRLI